MAQIIVGKKSRISKLPFKDEVHDMGDFIAEYPQTLGADILIVCRELQVGTITKSRRIDFLVYDTELNQIGIVELKNQTADEKVLLQILRYANWIRNNPDTVRYQVKKQGLEIDAEEIDTENIKVLIVAPKVTRSLAELCQYITAFDFEFIELQRFRDENGEVYAVVNPLEIDSPEPVPSKPRGEYDLAWFESQGVRPKQMADLETAIELLQNIVEEQEWELSLRYVKWSVRFQIPNGRNAFLIDLRKTKNHILALPLGPDFDPTSVHMTQDIRKKLKHSASAGPWWHVPLETEQIQEYIPLLGAAYETVIK